MLHRLLLLATLLTVGFASPCTFSYGNYHLTYGMRGTTAYFRLTLSGVGGYNGWTAVGFGDSMPTGIDVIVVRVLNGRVIVTDEFVQGFASPYPDRINNVVVSEARIVNGVVRATFSRAIHSSEMPFDAHLVGCQRWQFAAGLNRMSGQGDLFHHSQTPITQTVCLSQCRV